MIDEKSPTQVPRSGSVFLFLFALPFAAFGVFAAGKGVLSLIQGKTKDGLFLCLFALIFSSVGFGLMFATRFGSRLQKRIDALKLAHPVEPWLWRKEWADGRITSSTKGTMIGAWIFAGLWNLISSSVFIGLLGEKPHDKLAFLVLLFPLVGVGLLAWAVRATIRWKKFGQSTFKMLSLPGVIGGQLNGAIETSVKLKPEDGFHLKLACINRVHTGSGDNSSTSENILWEDEKTLVKELLDDDPRRSGIPVYFQIPTEVRESDDTNTNNRIIWRLEARAKVPGVDYLAQFEVPVFRTAASAAVSAPAKDPTLAYQAPREPYHLPARSRITVRIASSGGTEFYFPAARNMGPTSLLIGFLTIWTGAIYLMLKVHAPIFFPIIFGLFEAILLVALANALTKSTRVIVDAAGMKINSSWIFFRSVKQFAREDIADITTKVGMTSGQTSYYDIKVVGRSGRAVTAASALKDKKQAAWLIAEMRRLLKLESSLPASEISSEATYA